jgi:hypothetical protein
MTSRISVLAAAKTGQVRVFDRVGCRPGQARAYGSSPARPDGREDLDAFSRHCVELCRSAFRARRVPPLIA